MQSFKDFASNSMNGVKFGARRKLEHIIHADLAKEFGKDWKDKFSFGNSGSLGFKRGEAGSTHVTWILNKMGSRTTIARVYTISKGKITHKEKVKNTF